MADEWWSSAVRTGGDASACSTTAPATESAASRTSMSLQHGFHGAAAASSSSFLADPHMDWTQAFMGGEVEAPDAAATSFNALLQLQGDASHQFLLDQTEAVAPPPVPPAPYADGAAVAASRHGVSCLYADSQYCSSLVASSYGDVPATPTAAKTFSHLLLKNPQQQQQQQEQFPSFFSSSGLFHAPAPGSPQLLLQALEEHKPLKSNTELAVQDACSSSATRRSAPGSPVAVKKPRIETPSPLPTFKVRKEKLGDRITALQQLVSPFGKTDTASVLHEAVEYIKFLHDQVASLSSPYLSCGRPLQHQHQQGSDKDGREAKEDLRSQGLCLVPVASTYMVASETAAPEFWHPTFGGTFR